MNYTIEYFINKFSVIPENQWTTGVVETDNGRMCVLGHCGVVETSAGIVWTPEAGALNHFIESNGIISKEKDVSALNDGLVPGYSQKTPKGRILAALNNIQKKVKK
jgi:hypothetical protein